MGCLRQTLTVLLPLCPAMTDARLRIAIVGAGLGGLVFALSLHRFSRDISVDIYESTPKLTEYGAGIGIWKRPWRIMIDLGLEADLLAIANNGVHFSYRKSDQQTGVDFHNPTTGYELTNFHRAELQHVLSKHLPPSYPIHFSKRLVSSTESDSGEIVLSFADGSRATCDVVVGCDGIRSAVRGALYRSLAEAAEHRGDHVKAAESLFHIDARYSGNSAYRSLVPTRVLLEKHPGHRAAAGPLVCFGKNKHLIMYPVSRGRMINLVVFISRPELEGTVYDGRWVAPVTKEEMMEKFALWEPEAKSVLECMTDISLWAINIVVGLPTFVGKQVALLGDAAHAMTPHQGSGAGQAFEDGYMLAALLGHSSVTRTTVHHALQVYDMIRRPFAQDVQRRSRDTGLLYQLNALGFESLSEEESACANLSPEKLDELANAIDGKMDWQGVDSIVDECDRALHILKTKVVQPTSAPSSSWPAHKL